MRHLPLLLPAFAALLLPLAGFGAAFTPGDLVIYRVGNGTETLLSTGNSVFLDEYTPSGILKQSIALPTATSGSNNALIASGVGVSEGLLNLSPNGLYLTFTGYNATPSGLTTLQGGTKLSDSAYGRTVGLVGINGVVNTSTSLTDFATTNNPRSAVTVDGVHVYAAGGSDGLRYATIGASVSAQLNTTFPNLRNVGVFGNQLYVTSGVAGLRIGTVGIGTPTVGNQSISNLPGVPTAGSGDTYDQFYFAELNPAVAGLDTLYVANEGNGTTNAGGILKYGLQGGIWTLQGTIVGSATDPFHGLTGVVSGGVVTLFATTVGNADATGGGRLLKITDSTGYSGTLSGTPTLLATAGANENFRGVAFAPAVPEPGPLAALFAGLVVLGRWASRRRS